MNGMLHFSQLKPDVLIPYNKNYNNLLPSVVIYVRPQTNLLKYETAILTAVQKFGDVTYLANINGRIFCRDFLVAQHYSTEYYFAVYAKKAIAQFPEMIDEFEKHFNVSFNDAKIISAFDAPHFLGITPDELFDIFTDERDFKLFYGQTIKRINGYYIVNYDLPSIMGCYTPESNIFVVAVQLHSLNLDLHELNYGLFESLKNNIATPIIDEHKYTQHEWKEKVKRTYHISKGHINAIFDMTDFIFVNENEHLKIEETPFGRYIIEKKIMDAEDLNKLKYFNLAYLKQNDGSKKLLSIKEAAIGMTFDEICDLLAKIDKKTLWRN